MKRKKYVWFNQDNLKWEMLCGVSGFFVLILGFLYLLDEIIKQTFDGIGGFLLMIIGLMMLMYSSWFENNDRIERLESKMKKL